MAKKIQLSNQFKSLINNVINNNSKLNKLFQQQSINTLPIPNGEAVYYVEGADNTFPYSWGRLEIKYGSYTGEYVALFYATGDCNHLYYNTYKRSWSSWKQCS